MVLDSLILSSHETLYAALDRINRNGKGVVFVVDERHRFVGTLTDGDARRALLAHVPLNATVSEIIDKDTKLYSKILSFHPNPVTRENLRNAPISAPVGTPIEDILKLVSNSVCIIPLLDGDGRVADYFEYKAAFKAPVASPFLRGNELNYVVECIESSWISSQGRFVDRFESQFARFSGTDHAVAVSNGTAALHLALVALDIGPGDEVILPDLTFAATANAVLFTGATPVLVDVSPDSWCLDPSAVARAVTDRTRAIIPVHLYGQPADMAAIMAVAGAHGLVVIEDCAEALGAAIGDAPVGGFGHVGCFSFFGNKILTTGEGGMCVTSDPAIARRMVQLRDHGMSKERKYWHDRVGFNYRMTNLQAAIGVAQLEQVGHILSRRDEIDRRYRRLLSGCFQLTPQSNLPDRRRVTWLVSYLLNGHEDRDRLIASASLEGIDLRPFFYPLGDMPPYRQYRSAPTPVTHDLSRRGINLPTSLCFEPGSYAHIAKTVTTLLDSCGPIPAAVGEYA